MGDAVARSVADAAGAADAVDAVDVVGEVYEECAARRAVGLQARMRASQFAVEVGAGAEEQAMPAAVSIATPIFGSSGTTSSCLRYSSTGWQLSTSVSTTPPIVQPLRTRRSM